MRCHLLNVARLVAPILFPVGCVICIIFLVNTGNPNQRTWDFSEEEKNHDVEKEDPDMVEHLEYKYLPDLTQMSRISWEHDNKGTAADESNFTQYDAAKTNLDECNMKYKFNHCVSESIPTSRRIADSRPIGCSQMKYFADLPTVTVIIVIKKAHEHTLLRTLHSIINQTPGRLLNEIIIVHSRSDRDQAQLASFIQKSNIPKVKQIMQPDITQSQAKNKAVDQSSGDVIVFLRPYMEVTRNWLPPLLDPIVKDKYTVTCPTLDVIHPKTFVYTPLKIRRKSYSGFDWDLRYQPMGEIIDNLRTVQQQMSHTTKSYTAMTHSPVITEDVFAIRKSWFQELAGYNSKMTTVHAASIELSIKIWLCGGAIKVVPCSRAGYIAGPDIETQTNKQDKELMASTWFDEYTVYVMTKKEQNGLDKSITSEIDSLKEDLVCKPFKWFVEKIASDMLLVYPLPDLPPLAEGMLKNEFCNKCVTQVEARDQEKQMIEDPQQTKDRTKKIVVRPRHGRTAQMQNLDDCIKAEAIKLTRNKQLYWPENDECFDAAKTFRRQYKLAFAPCLRTKRLQRQGWKYDLDTRQLMSLGSEGYCLSVNQQCTMMELQPCSGQAYQRWEFEHIDIETIRGVDVT